MEKEANHKVEKILEKIRIQRIIKGFSQEYVGDQLDLSQYAYHKIENGKTKLHLNCLLKLCEVLEIEIQDLLDN